MPRIALDTIPRKTGSVYPEPYASDMAGRSSLKIGDAAGLTQFGANLVRLEPMAMSSHRHWHGAEDEFLYVTQGEVLLVEDTGETKLKAGDCAAFPAGVPNGHHLKNLSDQPAEFLVVGTKSFHETVTYTEVDMHGVITGEAMKFTRKDGAPINGNKQHD